MGPTPMNPNKEWRPGQPAEEELLESPEFGKPDRSRDALHDEPDDPHLGHIKRGNEERNHRRNETRERFTPQR